MYLAICKRVRPHILNRRFRPYYSIIFIIPVLHVRRKAFSHAAFKAAKNQKFLKMADRHSQTVRNRNMPQKPFKRRCAPAFHGGETYTQNAVHASRRRYRRYMCPCCCTAIRATQRDKIRLAVRRKMTGQKKGSPITGLPHAGKEHYV